MSTDKSCVNCPSKLSAGESVQFFGKSTGAPMCATYGTVLGNSKLTPADNHKLNARIARDCKSFGEPRPQRGHGKAFMPRITEMPDNIDQAIKMTSGGAAPVKSCNTCIFYMHPQEVSKRFGYTSGLCQAQGILILPHLTQQAAEDCGFATFGQSQDLKPELLELYTEDYYHVDLFAAYGAGVTHPLQHVSDAPVTDADRADGVIGWRKIADPNSETRFVLLPIYDPAQFTEAERSKIPQPGDDEHPELYLDHSNAVYKVAVCWRELDETPMAWGPAGVGKTEVARHMAYLMQMPFERFSITAATELDDLAGKMMYSPELGTYYQRGRMAIAWEKRCVMLIDEPNTGANDVWQFLRPLTDNSKQLVLDSASGERVNRNPHTYLMMAANPAWDPRNTGAQTIGDADSSRLMHLMFELPPPPLEKKIISARVALDGWTIEGNQLNLMMGVADDVRAMSEDGTLPVTWGPRVQIKVARALKWFSPIDAYKLAISDLEPLHQQTIIESVKSHFGEGV